MLPSAFFCSAIKDCNSINVPATGQLQCTQLQFSTWRGFGADEAKAKIKTTKAVQNKTAFISHPTGRYSRGNLSFEVPNELNEGSTKAMQLCPFFKLPLPKGISLLGLLDFQWEGVLGIHKRINIRGAMSKRGTSFATSSSIRRSLKAGITATLAASWKSYV